MLWLKRWDFLAKLAPSRGILRRGRIAKIREELTVLRPGGLGDVVLLTRACLELGSSPQSIFWILERRNAPWADYLGLPHRCYDNANTFWQAIAGRERARIVVNSEQTFGLASVFASRVVSPQGLLIGFSSNSRADLYDRVITYDYEKHESAMFGALLKSAQTEIQLEAASSFHLPDAAPPPSTPFAVIAIAGRQASEKQISLSAWKELVSRARSYADDVYFVGSKIDERFATDLAHSCKATVQNLVGKLSFREVVALIRNATRLLSVDSGLVHIADFFSIPSDVVFTTSSPKKWGPTTAGSEVLSIDKVGEGFITEAQR